MTKQITNYKELLEEKARLQELLVVQKQQIKADWESIKDDIRPSFIVMSTVRNLFTRKATGVVAGLGINIFADGLIKKVLLARTGWLTRWVVPFLVKNFASHLVDEPEKILDRIKHMFSKNGKKHQEAGMDTV
jgi:hypothetical protein